MTEYKLPIRTYWMSGCSIGLDPIRIEMCKVADVRELVERMQVEAARGRDAIEVCRHFVREVLAQDIHNGLTQTGEVSKESMAELFEMAREALAAIDKD